ncbi:MAG TPA: amidase family protein [Aliidongia sp.]|uniref:amidase n=1 Tax=Aliidongia sp. TaxID=1914230 RepID=UPI002DDCC1DC|nr:amidase family protein [Aliidongia sp.]HEV2673033.1 amidase family protein [Aliidongia sp.]
MTSTSTKLEPCFLTAAEAAAKIKACTLTSEALVRSCLDRIAARDADVKAWLYLDPDYAVRQAREIDKRPATHPLHGLPFGVKDVMDTADMPTTQNSGFYQGHRPTKDAACVAIVRQRGSVVLGKTDTVEYASNGRRAATRNPYNLAHTPGGSSSGSGAAVGDFQVPLAFGTQTAGSHIRPASFNGIYGLKPTWGIVSREGFKQFSVSLDTVGWYGRGVDDLALVASAFELEGMGDTVAAEASSLRVAYCETPFWDKAEAATHQAMETAAHRLEKAGATIIPLRLSPAFARLHDAQMTVMHGEGRWAFLPEYLVQKGDLQSELLLTATGQRGVTPQSMIAAYDLAASCRREFDALFGDFDVVLTPAAAGEAPAGVNFVGDYVFNGFWTLLHVPCLAIPTTTGSQGLPVGIQLVGPRMSDARLIAIARALAPVIDTEAEERLFRLRAA